MAGQHSLFEGKFFPLFLLIPSRVVFRRLVAEARTEEDFVVIGFSTLRFRFGVGESAPCEIVLLNDLELT